MVCLECSVKGKHEKKKKEKLDAKKCRTYSACNIKIKNYQKSSILYENIDIQTI